MSYHNFKDYFDDSLTYLYYDNSFEIVDYLCSKNFKIK